MPPKRTFCVEFDDLFDDVCLPVLEMCEQLKEHNPNFKVTLFTIPRRISDTVITLFKKRPYIHLAPHGWRHTKGECLAWTDDEAVEKITRAAQRGIDAPIFRAPTWQLDEHLYKACGSLDYALATHAQYRVPNTGVREYIYNDDQQIGKRNYIPIHGHFTPRTTNYFKDMLKDGRLDFPQNAEFKFPEELACVY